MTPDETQALIADANRRVYEEGDILEPATPDEKLIARLADALAVLSAPQEAKWEHGVICGEDLLHRLMDTLAYYHCRSVNPKADSPHLGYHAMSEDQREFLRERQREAAEEVLRMWQADLEWEFGLRWNGEIVRSGSRETVQDYFEMWGGQIERRRPAGPWLPVGGDDE